jgi:fructokinase
MSSNGPKATPNGRPILIGEVLFDCFPDGSRVLGGAPFNVAWHLQAMGLAPLLVSRVGTDALGDRILTAMREWGLETTAIQRDPDRPTGTVEVRLDDGPQFEIVPDRAWDHLDGRDATAALAEVDGALLYHGTLIARAEPAATAVQTLRAASGLPVFLDVNLRDPWWTAAAVRRMLFGTRWLKLNEDELDALDDGETATPLPDRLRAARTRWALDTVVLTRGADGATAVSADGAIDGSAPQPPRMVDSVGAGDAFSAVWIAGLLRGWPWRITFDRALAFASLVCSHRGAVIPDRSVYTSMMETWSDSVAVDTG